MRGLRALGTTILLTTHYMDEAQQLSDRVVVLVGGVVAADGTPDELGALAGEHAVIRYREPGGALAAPPLGLRVERREGWVDVMTNQPTADLQRLTTWAMEHDVELSGLELARPTLEETYLSLTGRAQPAEAAAT